MIKTTKSAVEQPVIIELCDLTSVAFAKAAALIRQGYVFSKATPPVAFAMTGQSAITLELGEPDAEALAGAAAASALTLAQQKAREQREDLAAQKRTREYEERLEKQAQLATEIEAAKAHLKQLEQAHRTA